MRIAILIFDDLIDEGNATYGEVSAADKIASQKLLHLIPLWQAFAHFSSPPVLRAITMSLVAFLLVTVCFRRRASRFISGPTYPVTVAPARFSTESLASPALITCKAICPTSFLSSPHIIATVRIWSHFHHAF